METNNKNSEANIPSIIIGKLMNVGGILQREGNRLLLPFNLNQQQFSILFEIAKAGEVQQKNMVNRLVLEKAHVSKVVKKLNVMGLIHINNKPDDKRSALLSATDKGKQVVEDCRGVFQQWNNDWYELYSNDELLQILDSVGKLQNLFKRKIAKPNIL